MVPTGEQNGKESVQARSSGVQRLDLRGKVGLAAARSGSVEVLEVDESWIATEKRVQR